MTSIKLHVKDWNYTDPDEMVRDRIVFGRSSSKVRKKLTNEGEKLTLEKAIQISQNYEYSQEQLKLMEGTDVQHMHAVSKTAHRPRYSGNRRSQQTGSNYRMHKKKLFSLKLGTEHCRNCGYQHKPVDSCPAKGKQCDSCKKWNHFAKVCRSNPNVNISQNSNVHGVSTQPEQSGSESDNFFIDIIFIRINHIN